LKWVPRGVVPRNLLAEPPTLLIALESLDLRATLVTDLSPLNDLPSLKKVKVRDSKLDPGALRAFAAGQPGVELDRT